MKLLEGVKIVDLSTVVLGPYATQMLGDLGADVIKVEAPEGDIFRDVAPSRHKGMGAPFLNLNRNKRSIRLNLKHESGQRAFELLVKNADVLLHNMRPAAAERLGIGIERLHTLNPRLVYCYGVGFGGDGPYAGRPAYDDIIQAQSGVTALAADSDGEPHFVPTVIADKVTALFAVQGVLSALLYRERSGEGLAVEVPMFECMANFLLAEHMAERVFDPASGKAGYERLLNEYHRPYRTEDGHIAVLPYSTTHWQSVLTLLGRADLAAADWVTNGDSRSRRISELYQVLAERLLTGTTANWLKEFRTLDVPCSRVRTIDELFSDEHLQVVDFFHQCDHPSEGRVTVAGYPLNVRKVAKAPDGPAPNLGQQTVEILVEMGLARDEAERIASEP